VPGLSVNDSVEFIQDGFHLRRVEVDSAEGDIPELSKRALKEESFFHRKNVYPYLKRQGV